MRVFQSLKLKTVGIIDAHAIPALHHCTIHYYLSFNKENVNSSVGLMQMVT